MPGSFLDLLKVKLANSNQYEIDVEYIQIITGIHLEWGLKIQIANFYTRTEFRQDENGDLWTELALNIHGRHIS